MAETDSTKLSEITLALIDDDELVHMSWQIAAKARGHQIAVFSSADEFFAASIDRSVPVYVDYCLHGRATGGEVAQRALDCGYEQVFLCTGMDVPIEDRPAGLKGIFGKEYPEVP